MRLVPLLLVLTGCLAGCLTVGLSDRDRLKMALEEYNDGLRWGKVEAACAHLPVALRQPFAERFQQLSGELEVMDYEVQRIEWDKKQGTARVRVDMSWSLKRRGIVERTVLEQKWQEAGTGQWIVAEQRRITGSQVPFLDDPPPAAAAPPPPSAPAPAPTSRVIP